MSLQIKLSSDSDLNNWMKFCVYENIHPRINWKCEQRLSVQCLNNLHPKSVDALTQMAEYNSVRQEMFNLSDEETVNQQPSASI